MTYLLDTNICAFLMKGRFPSLNRKILTLDPSEISVSVVTLFELEYGATKAKWGYQRREDMNLFLSAFNATPFTENDALTAGRIRATLERLGAPIGAYDLLIAAQGVVRGLTVVTHNLGEFRRVPGLIVEDWVEE